MSKKQLNGGSQGKTGSSEEYKVGYANQRPLPPGGALFKLEWLKRYNERPSPKQVQGIFQSWDTAYDIEEHHDYQLPSFSKKSGLLMLAPREVA